jgi:hypothetical protein
LNLSFSKTKFFFVSVHLFHFCATFQGISNRLKVLIAFLD